jgi:hypothetical protein
VIHESVNKAITSTARFMTTELRSHAISDGWEPHVAQGLSIKWDGSTLKHDLGEHTFDEAFVHEYGDERKRPKATVRRFLNRPGKSEHNLISSLDYYLGDN